MIYFDSNMLKMLSPSLFPLQVDYPTLTAEHTSIMAAYLTPELYESLKGRQTSMGSKLDDVIRPGVEVPDLRVGLIAGDEECYTAFMEIFKGVTEDIQGLLPTYKVSLAFDPAGIDASLFVDGTRVNSIMVSLTRNISGFALPSRIKRKDRQKLMSRVLLAIEKIQEELGRGKFSVLADIEGDRAMKEKGLLPPGPGQDKSMMRKSGTARDWPDGRGVFEIGSQVVWINEEDHLKFISRAERGDLKVAVAELLRLSEHMEKYLNSVGLQYMYQPNFGFLSSSPLNVGTGLRLEASVALEGFRYTGKNKKMVNDELDLIIVKDKDLEAQGTYFLLSNRRTMFPDISSQIQAFLQPVGQLMESHQGQPAPEFEDKDVLMGENHVDAPSESEVYVGETGEGEYYEDFNEEEPKEELGPGDEEEQDGIAEKPEQQEGEGFNTGVDEWYETKEDDGGAGAGASTVSEANKIGLDLDHVRGLVANEMSELLVDDSIKPFYRSDIDAEQQQELSSPAF